MVESEPAGQDTPRFTGDSECVVSATAFTTDGSSVALTVQGIDIADDASVRTYDARADGGVRLEDPLEFLAQPDSVVLTRAFATRRGLRIGEQIDLDTPTGRQAMWPGGPN